MNEIRKPWEQIEGEPGLWFERFSLWRSLGPSRTIEDAWRQDRAKKGLSGKRPHFRWYEVRKEWHWDERAQAWDDYRAKELRRNEIEAEKEARNQARSDRRALIDGFTGTMSTALITYTQSVDRLSGLLDQLQRRLQAEQDPDKREALQERITQLAGELASLAALPDLTKAMEMVVKQMRTEFGDFILPEAHRSPANEGDDSGVELQPDGDTLRIIVYD